MLRSNFKNLIVIALLSNLTLSAYSQEVTTPPAPTAPPAPTSNGGPQTSSAIAIPDYLEDQIKTSHDACMKAVATVKEKLPKLTEYQIAVKSSNIKQSKAMIDLWGGAHEQRKLLNSGIKEQTLNMEVCKQFEDSCNAIPDGVTCDEDSGYTCITSWPNGSASNLNQITDKKSCVAQYNKIAVGIFNTLSEMQASLDANRSFLQHITDDPLQAAIVGGAVIGGAVLVNEMIDDNGDKKARKEAAAKKKKEEEEAAANGTDTAGYAVDNNCEKFNVLSNSDCVTRYQADCFENPSANGCSTFNNTFCNAPPTTDSAKKAMGEKAGTGANSAYCLYAQARGKCSGTYAATSPLTCSWLSNVEANKGSGEVCSSVTSLMQSSCLVHTTSASFEASCAANSSDPICSSALKNYIPGVHSTTASAQSVAASNSQSVIGSAVAPTTNSTTQNSGTFSAVLSSINNAWNSVTGSDSASSSSSAAVATQPVAGVQSANTKLFGSSNAAVSNICASGYLADVSKSECFKAN